MLKNACTIWQGVRITIKWITPKFSKITPNTLSILFPSASQYFRGYIIFNFELIFPLLFLLFKHINVHNWYFFYSWFTWNHTVYFTVNLCSTWCYWICPLDTSEGDLFLLMCTVILFLLSTCFISSVFVFINLAVLYIPPGVYVCPEYVNMVRLILLVVLRSLICW